MKKSVYSIFDKVAEVYHNPWVESSDQTAGRAFSFVCADKNTLYGMCPSDFVLYRVGKFDDVSGGFSSEYVPVKILDGRDPGVLSDEP